MIGLKLEGVLSHSLVAAMNPSIRGGFLRGAGNAPPRGASLPLKVSAGKIR